MSYYQYHVFFCCNQREPAAGRAATTTAPRRCATTPSSGSRSWAAGPGHVRVNQAGCMDRCEEGPVLVVYPEGVWYTYVDRADVDEIIEEHLGKGRVVERLRI